MNSKNNNDKEDVDLSFLFNKVKSVFEGILVSLYRFIIFLLKKWRVLTVLIVLGLFLGYFLTDNDKVPKETELIVQINFDAVSSVYDAVNQLQNIIKERDTTTLKTHNLYKDEEYVIKEIEIEPIVNVFDIFENEPGNQRSIQIILGEEIKHEDFLKSDYFVHQYKKHRIRLKLSYFVEDEGINSFLSFLNSNNTFSAIQKTAAESAQDNILKNEQSLKDIDSIVQVYGYRLNRIDAGSQIYFNTSENSNVNIHLLFEEKADVIEFNSELKIDLLKQDKVVKLLNTPFLTTKTSVLSNKMFLLPIVFIFLYLIFIIIKLIFINARKMSEGREQ